MALVHDMAELLVGDITPVDGVPKSEKSRREASTMDYLCRDLLRNVDGGEAGEDIRKVWQEYEDGETEESKFVHDVDKVELILQMMDYERMGKGKIDLGEFTWVADRIQLSEVRSWCEECLKERGDLWKAVQKEPTGLLVRDGQRSNGGKVADEADAMKKEHDEYYGANGTNGH